jgi:cytochrome oxidase assembly protein ShyY1
MTQVTTTAAHAAAALREAAESTAHTLSGLVGDAQERLEHLHLPTLHVPAIAHRPSRARVAAPWITLAVIALAVAAVVVRKRSSRRSPLQLADDPSQRHAA